jgi:alpha-glucoside transport system permease protein
VSTGTPPIAPVDAPPGGTRPITSEPPGGTATGPLVWVLRLVSMLAVPAVIAVFFFTIQFLRDTSGNKVLQVGLALVVGVVGVWVMYWGMDQAINALPERLGEALRPFAFVGPAVVVLTFYLVWPAINTSYLAVLDRRGEEFVGLDNFVTLFTTDAYLVSMRNSILWVLIVPALAVVIGLVVATLADRMGQVAENVSKSLIFMPMAISFVAASVVWTFVYSFRPEGFGQQIGLLNAIRGALDMDPVLWLSQTPENNLYLMIILVWLQTGFAMVILSSAIKGVPDELLEAARIDGANEWQVFTRIIIPSIATTIVVVWTTIVITTWKVFDIVWVNTGGANDTSVVAERMVTEFFVNNNDGIGAALAVVLFLAVIPILTINIRRFKEQEQTR